ncbi:hypothetical protein ACFVMC_19020 [Nocardia sp. NPDC127579]|uniref:hypothetical protein n=1 Tax=Nocardia sp. NPDC127579 TaxID=3345402 RepID=UPI0036320417
MTSMRSGRWTAAAVLAGLLCVTNSPVAVAFPAPDQDVSRLLAATLCETSWNYTESGLQAIAAAQNMYATEMLKWPHEEARRRMFGAPEATNDARRKACADREKYLALVAELERQYAGAVKKEYLGAAKRERFQEERRVAYERAVCLDLPDVQRKGGSPSTAIWNRCRSQGLLS